MRTALLTTAISLLACNASFAQTESPPYVDDRSDAAAIVKSFYNAISRQEYARAWDYFGDQKPATSFDKFVEGYADTERVDVATGGQKYRYYLLWITDLGEEEKAEIQELTLLR